MWLATAAWAVGEVGVRRSPRGDRGARIAWTIGVVFAILHAVLVFHYVHGWSHGAAALDTMRQGEERLGVGWSGGIYVNYAFIAIWALDAGWWWLAAPSRAARARGLEVARFAFFVFMFVNGAIVFAAGAGRWLGVACVAAAVLGGPIWRAPRPAADRGRGGRT